MILYRILLFISLTILLTSASANDNAVAKTQEQVVRNFVSAFNEKDLKTMLLLVTEDVQWASINGDKIILETKNKRELQQTMTAYFKSASSSQSTIANISSTGSRVSATEVSSFELKHKVHKQHSLSVYEFSDQLIKRVYYFPSEKLPANE